jgi:regulatory protein YycI of two-component signal transduction system YycFG
LSRFIPASAGAGVWVLNSYGIGVEKMCTSLVLVKSYSRKKYVKENMSLIVLFLTSKQFIISKKSSCIPEIKHEQQHSLISFLRIHK